MPPVTVTLIVPFAPPKQDTGVATAVAVGEPSCITVALVVFVQPFASVTVTV